LKSSPKVVTPVKTGPAKSGMDSGFRSTSSGGLLAEVGPLGFAELSKRLPLEAYEPIDRNDVLGVRATFLRVHQF
jgi:hypothetical protein